MTSEMVVLIGQMKIIAALIFIGFMTQRLKVLNNEQINGFSAVLSRFILPCMIVTLIPNGGTRAEMFGMWKFLLATAAMLFMGNVMGYFQAKAIRLPLPTRNMHIVVTGFGNGGFIGIPVVMAVYPETASLICAVWLLAEATMYWVFGPLIADTSEVRKLNLEKLVSPLTIAIVIGFVLLIIGFDLKQFVVWNTLTEVGGLTKYFAPLYIGLNLGRQGFKKAFSNPKVLFSTPVKLIIIPVVAFYLLGKTGILSGDTLTMLIILLGTPTGMAVPIIANMTGNDEAYATAGSIINTLLCLVTIPFVLYLTTIL